MRSPQKRGAHISDVGAQRRTAAAEKSEEKENRSPSGVCLMSLGELSTKSARRRQCEGGSTANQTPNCFAPDDDSYGNSTGTLQAQRSNVTSGTMSAAAQQLLLLDEGAANSSLLMSSNSFFAEEKVRPPETGTS